MLKGVWLAWGVPLFMLLHGDDSHPAGVLLAACGGWEGVAWEMCKALVCRLFVSVNIPVCAALLLSLVCFLGGCRCLSQADIYVKCPLVWCGGMRGTEADRHRQIPCGVRLPWLSRYITTTDYAFSLLTSSSV